VPLFPLIFGWVAAVAGVGFAIIMACIAYNVLVAAISGCLGDKT